MGINLVSIYATCFLGTALMCTILFNNRWRFKQKDPENRVFLAIMILVLICNLLDPITFSLDGKPGLFSRLIGYFGNSWTYFCNLWVGSLWIVLMLIHLLGTVPKPYVYVLGILNGSGTVVLLVNCFYPLAFKLDENNVYSRGPLFVVFVGLVFVYMLYSFGTYLYIRHRAGNIKFFPIWAYALPVAFGTVLEFHLYGVSLIWSSLAVSFAGVAFSYQNELIFRDSLTGLYNRSFFEKISSNMKSSRKSDYAVMLLDINAFKSINDRFGHAEGDKAIIQTAQILRRVAGKDGEAIRYAGDEFVMLMNIDHGNTVEDYIKQIREAFANYNAVSGKTYELSVSIGCQSADLNHQTYEEIISLVDQLMYEDKERFYEENEYLVRRAN